MLLLRNVTLRRGGRAILDQLSFQVAAGWSPTTILGADAREAVVQVLSGQRPKSGAVTWRGTPLQALARKVRPFQQAPAVNPNQTVAQLLASRTAGADRRPGPHDPDDLARRFGLDGVKSSAVRSLSEAARLRLQLARLALERRPIVVLDSPASTLTGDARQTFLADLSGMLSALSHPDGVVLLATGSVEEAEAASGWLFVLAGGQVAQAGPSPDVFAGPDTLTVAEATTRPRLNLLDIALANGTARLVDGSLFATGALPVLPRSGPCRLAFRPRDAHLRRTGETDQRFPARLVGEEWHVGQRHLRLTFGGAMWLAPAPEDMGAAEPGYVVNVFVDSARLMAFDGVGLSTASSPDVLLFEASTGG